MTLTRPPVSATATRPQPVRRVIAILVALAVGTVGGFATGRVTAPLHRHPVPAPRVAQLSLDGSCSQVTRDVGTRVQSLESIAVKVGYHSGWPEGTAGDQIPKFGMMLNGAVGHWSFNMPESEPWRGPSLGNWFGFGNGSTSPAQQQAVRWLSTVSPTKGWSYVPRFPDDTWGEFFGRDVDGTLVFDRSLSIPQSVDVGRFNLKMAVFDVDGSMIERELLVTC